MTDRRLLRSNGRVAHVSLRGEVEAERFAEGEVQRVVVALTDLRPAPEPGRRERQLGFGEEFTVLDRDRGHAFGFCARDGACGWIEQAGLGAAVDVTHRVGVIRSYAKATPDLKVAEPVMPLSLGAALRVEETKGDWARFAAPVGTPCWMPARHLAAPAPARDPVEVAALFLGTPYLWGGNSAMGIDCSGLVQAAWLASGRACPPDSDLQAGMPGARVTRESVARGDLMFWKGHVAICEDGDTMIHANGHHMAVVREGLDAGIARIGTPALILRWRAA